jgi:hypothetical protein
VEAVEDQAKRRVIGPLHDVPGLPPEPDMPSPRQGLVADAQPTFGSTVCHPPKVGGGLSRIVDGGGVNVAADEHKVGAEGLHHVELALRPVEVTEALRFRHGLELAERLEDRDVEPQAFGQGTNVLRSATERQQVLLKNLHTCEPDAGGRLQLVRQASRKADRRDLLRQRGSRLRS